jgi:hypothetical protein
LTIDGQQIKGCLRREVWDTFNYNASLSAHAGTPPRRWEENSHISGDHNFFCHISSSWHAQNQDPRLSACLRKVIRLREKEGEKDRNKREKTMNSVATTYAWQPICNATRAAHALCPDQCFEHTLWQ